MNDAHDNAETDHEMLDRLTPPRLRYRRIKTADPVEGRQFRAMNSDTGEILLCSDLIELLRRIAHDLATENSRWSIELETCYWFSLDGGCYELIKDRGLCAKHLSRVVGRLV